MKAWRAGMAIALALAACTDPAAGAGWKGGIAVLGDSYSDEYEFYPPDRAMARNWVEILAECRKLDFGTYSRQSRGEPRNQGYAYNWARSDATSVDMIQAGQLAGVLGQVRSGEVGLVCIFVGGNDFIAALQSSDPNTAVPTATAQVERNVELTVDSILQANEDVQLFVSTIPDVRDLPEFADPIRAGLLSGEVSRTTARALRDCNAKIRGLAERSDRVTVFDLDLASGMSRLVYPTYVPLGNLRLARFGYANDLQHVFIGDRRHIGTLVQGKMAQHFIDAVNARFDAGIPRLTDQEILDYARSLAQRPNRLASSRPTAEIGRAVSVSGGMP